MTPSHATAPTAAAGAPRPAEAPIRLMIVDDSQIARAVLSRMLASHKQFEVVALASNAGEALDTLKTTRVDIVLLDWNMPVMGGIEFLRTLRQKDVETQPKVVFCTTENDAAHIRAAIDAGADEYVMKPFDRETLESKLQIVGIA